MRIRAKSWITRLPDFAIYELAVGGGRLALCPAPGAAGNYDADLQVILDWKPALVLTMTVQSELAQCGAATFGADIACHGVDWRHVPTPDFGVPEQFDWPMVFAQIKTRLQRGQGVLVHCLGGCGRSGMVVLRMMIVTGEHPDTALTRLRAVRPCAVETGAQLDWARRDESR